jgi:hypothetical protein
MTPTGSDDEDAADVGRVLAGDLAAFAPSSGAGRAGWSTLPGGSAGTARPPRTWRKKRLSRRSGRFMRFAASRRSPRGRRRLLGIRRNCGPRQSRSERESADRSRSLGAAGDRKPFPVVETIFNESAGQFSPDGRLVIRSVPDSSLRPSKAQPPYGTDVGLGARSVSRANGAYRFPVACQIESRAPWPGPAVGRSG